MNSNNLISLSCPMVQPRCRGASTTDRGGCPLFHLRIILYEVDLALVVKACLCTTTLYYLTYFVDCIVDFLSGQVLGHEVRWVGGSKDLHI